MTKIVLDAEAFKALASDTRLQILKALDARPLTVSELSRLLNLNKATVFEHLKQLMAAELAKREDDPARKWVYYRLTWKGKNVLHPENAQIFLMLGMATLGLGGAVLQTAHLAQLWLQEKSSQSASSAGPGMFADNANREENQLRVGNEEADTSAQTAGGSSGDPQPAAAQPSSTGSPPADKAGGAGGASPSTGQEDSVGEADVMPVDADQAPAIAGDAQAWWEPLTSNYFLTLLGILVFLGLLALIVWTLYSGQRKERRDITRRITMLPVDVNREEPTLGTAA